MIITQVFMLITHKTAGQSAVSMQAFYTINFRNSFHHICVYKYDLGLRLCNRNYGSVYVYMCNTYHCQPEYKYRMTFTMVPYLSTYTEQVVI